METYVLDKHKILTEDEVQNFLEEFPYDLLDESHPYLLVVKVKKGNMPRKLMINYYPERMPTSTMAFVAKKVRSELKDKVPNLRHFEFSDPDLWKIKVD